MISVLLKAGHATKQVNATCKVHIITPNFAGLTHLYKLQLCISHAALLMVLNEESEGHNEIVMDWQDMQEQNVVFVQRPLVSNVD